MTKLLQCECGHGLMKLQRSPEDKAVFRAKCSACGMPWEFTKRQIGAATKEARNANS